jgi:hypothetical protein
LYSLSIFASAALYATAACAYAFFFPSLGLPFFFAGAGLPFALPLNLWDLGF